MIYSTMIDRLIQPGSPRPKHSKGKRALAWFVIGLGIKIAITAIAFLALADRGEVAPNSFSSISFERNQNNG